MKLVVVLCALGLAGSLVAQPPAASPKPAAAKKSAVKAPEPPPVPRPDGLYATLHTSAGPITIQFHEDQAPQTVKSFIAYSRGGKSWVDPKTKRRTTRAMYPGTIFHRVIPGFMIQGGDPTGTGQGSCDRIPDEWTNGFKFDAPGRVAMANASAPNTAGCQFFITETPQPHLDGKFTIFGQVIEGQDVVKKISAMPRNASDRPNEPVKIERIAVERWLDGKLGPLVKPAPRKAATKKPAAK